MILLCLVSGLGGYTLHMQDPAGGQPAANPAAEQPSNVPSGASTSGWRSFEERVLLESMPSSNESSEASVNQQPVIPEEPPLLDENTRRAELAARLRTNWWGVAYTDTILDSFVRTQLHIEKHIEAALVEDGCSPQVVFERRHQIRGFLFYPEGRALREDTYADFMTPVFLQKISTYRLSDHPLETLKGKAIFSISRDIREQLQESEHSYTNHILYNAFQVLLAQYQTEFHEVSGLPTALAT